MTIAVPVLGAGCWVLVPGSGFGVRRCAAAAQQARERFLVIPFENPAREARVYWVSEASAVLLADDLNALGKHAYTREERLDAFQRLQVPPVATLSHATVIRLGQVVGATHVVIGSFRLTGGMLSVRAQSITARHRADGARIRRSRPARGSLCDFRSASAGASPGRRRRARRPRGPRCRCSKTTSRGSSRRRRRRRSVISRRRSSSIPASIARGSRCGTFIMTKATDRSRS